MRKNYNTVPKQLRLYLGEEDIKILEEKFIISQEKSTPDLILIAYEWDARDVFSRLSPEFSRIQSLNTSWSNARLRKDLNQDVVKIKLYWTVMRHNDPPRYGLLLDGSAHYLKDGEKDLDNFHYTKEALELGIVGNTDLKSQMEIRPEEDWVREVMRICRL